MGFLLILKFVGVAAILGPAIQFKGILPFAVSAGPGLLMLLGSLFPPDEGGMERFLARLGVVGAVGHVGMIVAMLVHIFTGHPSESPGFIVASVVATVPAVWLTLRNAKGQEPISEKLTFVSDDVLVIVICLAFVAISAFLAVSRPGLLFQPEWLASGGFFGLGALMMLWFRARNTDAIRAAKGDARRRGRIFGVVAWAASLGLTVALAGALWTRGGQADRPELVYTVLAISALGALAPLLARFAKHLPWRVTQDVTDGGIVEGRGGKDLLIPWSEIESLQLGDWMGHAAVFIRIRNPFNALFDDPARKRWIKAEAWTGAHIVIMAATSRGNFEDLVARARRLSPT